MEMDTAGQMPISPKHAATIDLVLQQVAARVQELTPILGYAPAPDLSLEDLRKGPLAKHLRTIARYAEGYDLGGDGDIRSNIRIVSRWIYGTAMKRGYRLPPDFHKTPLGELIYEALCRYVPRAERLDVTATRKLLGVARQTLHQWAQEGTLQPIYDQGQLTFQRTIVEAFKEKREQVRSNRD